MDNSFSSSFGKDKFKKLLAQYEEMASGKQPAYFDADQLTEIAEYYASLDDYEKSLDVIEFSLKIHPGTIEILTLKAHLLIETDHIQEAKEIAYSMPDYEYDVKRLKALLFTKENKIDEAKRMLQRMIEEEEEVDEESYLDAAYVFMDNEYPEEALPWFEKALKLVPGDMTIQQDYAECCFRTNNIERAIVWYNKVLDEDPYSTECWFGLGKSYSMNDDFQKAIEAFDFVLAINPHHTAAILLKAHAYSQIENYTEAAELYLKYTEYNPDEERPYYMAGICYYNLGSYEEALECFLKATQRKPLLDYFTVDAFQYMAGCYIHKNDHAKALDAIDNAIQLDYKNADLLITKGSIFLRQEEFDSANEIFQEALELDNFENPDSYISIALAYHDNNLFDLALKYLIGLQESYPGHGLSYIYIAYIYLLKNDKDKFKEYFMKAMEQNPNNITQFTNQLSSDQAEIKELILNLKQSIEENY